MVCPLRFVLLGASAAVALCGVAFVTHNSAKRSDRQGKVKDDTVWWRTFVDMLTGRYLWQAYQDWRERDVEPKLT
ncbi:g1107 [Coccomyxa viridis]|uniref:G1107 protein n=1 Tax=Coccomyxa viridis TaxID=1274662 RepID=A0ABP1FL19_9CHLO